MLITEKNARKGMEVVVNSRIQGLVEGIVDRTDHGYVVVKPKIAMVVLEFWCKQTGTSAFTPDDPVIRRKRKAMEKEKSEPLGAFIVLDEAGTGR